MLFLSKTNYNNLIKNDRADLVNIIKRYSANNCLITEKCLKGALQAMKKKMKLIDIRPKERISYQSSDNLSWYFF